MESTLTSTSTSSSSESNSSSNQQVHARAGEARIKPQFLLPRVIPPAVSSSSSSSARHDDDDAEPSPAAKKPRLRGQNKKREFHKAVDSNKICIATALGKVCPYGEKCLFNHDIELYKSTKPPDLEGVCVFVERKGSCPFGVLCRYAASHPDPMPHWEIPAQFEERNFLSKELQKALRGKKYRFQSSNQQEEKEEREEETGKEIEEKDEEEDAAGEKNDLEDGTEDGSNTSDVPIKLRQAEKKTLDFRGKLYLAPLTTVGNLPFRRICKGFGADITCGEMAMAPNLLQGQNSEWALLRRHSSEDFFGVQIAGCNPMVMSRVAELIDRESDVDFIDINMGCPIDLVFRQGAGSALLGRTNKVCAMVKAIVKSIDVPLTAKMRTGVDNDHISATQLIPKFADLGVSALALHGRSKRQHYYHLANWGVIHECAKSTSVPLFGNGDILSYADYRQHVEDTPLAGAMLARGALIKPWLFTEIKERRDWDISSRERFDMLKEFCRFGLEHWGSDTQGVSNTRRFLLEWQSFLHRYIPLGLLEVLPQRMNERPPPFVGRDDLETLMASTNSADWVKLSEMLLGKAPEDFRFVPKHKANSIGNDMETQG